MQTGTHYFHWLWDVYRPLDYEPVQVRQIEENSTVVSRFHWFILTAWLHPLIMNGKPVIRFVKGFHTAIAFSEKAYVHFGELQELTGEESFWFYRVFLPFLKREISRRYNIKTISIHGYHEKVGFSHPPKKYMFNISRSKCYFIISKEPPRPERLPKDIGQLLWPSWRSGAG